MSVHPDRVAVACITCGVAREVFWRGRLLAARRQCAACNGTAKHESDEARRAAERAATAKYRAANRPVKVKVAKPVAPRKVSPPKADNGGKSAPALKVSAHREKALPEKYVPAIELCCVETDQGMCERRYPCRVHKDAA